MDEATSSQSKAVYTNHISDTIASAVDEDRISPPPPSLAQLQLEVDGFESAVKSLEKAGKKGDELTQLWLEVGIRKDQFRVATAKGYEGSVDVSRREKAALAAIFTSLQGFEWNRKWGWLGLLKSVAKPEVAVFAASASLFEGVTTVKLTSIGMVSGLRFSGLGCRGTLPPQIGDFETLRHADLSWNLIHGSLPRQIGALQGLETLSLAGNQLSGLLHADTLSELVNLKLIDLSSNQLDGEIPDCFHGMTKLSSLDLSNNKLVGFLPSSISCCGKLETLKLANNALSGEIKATTFSRLTMLRDVNLSQNCFSGPGLAAFCGGGCTSLERLQLFDNQLTGKFSSELAGRLDKLEILYIHKNRMHGFIPDDLCTLTSLRRLNISDNNFRGSLPELLGNLVNLQCLLASGNGIIGPLPRTFSQLVKLRDYCILKNYPSEQNVIPRGFSRNTFERIHIVGPEMGLNSVTWRHSDLYDDFPKDETAFELFERRLHIQLGRP